MKKILSLLGTTVALIGTSTTSLVRIVKTLK